MIVRQAEFAEHKDICSLAKTSKYTKDFSSIMFSGQAAYEKGWIWLALEPQDMLGFYCVRHKVREPVTSLYFIGVDPSAHRTGVGSELLRHLEANTPHSIVHLNVANENESAFKFYEAHGYTIIGEALKGKGKKLEKLL